MEKITEIDCIEINGVFYDKKEIKKLKNEIEKLREENCKLKGIIDGFKIALDVKNRRKGKKDEKQNIRGN